MKFFPSTPGSKNMAEKNMELSRREFLVSAIATSNALAVHPVTAQTLVMTDSVGIHDEMVQVKNGDTLVPAYMAYPASGKDFPVVLVVQEIFGVHEHIKDVCRRLAKLGYLAVAPELYIRQGDVSRIGNAREIITNVVSKVPDAQVLSDLDATVSFVAKHGKGDTKRLAITGFCWGGRIVWLYSAHNPQLKAAIAWYGKLTAPVTTLQPKHPLDIAAQIKVPVLGLYGGQDQGIPLETIERMKDLLAQGTSKSAIHVYADAPHAFFADYRPSYRKEAAEDGWKRLQAWLSANGM
jgi:carboxymethylenebutenolidase